MSIKVIINKMHVTNLYVTEIEIWASFRPVGNTGKKIWANYEHFLTAFFSCFQGEKK